MAGLPPIGVKFTANATAAITAINKMVAGLERLGEAARAAVVATDEAFAAMSESAGSLASVAESAGAAKTQLQGVARASRSITKATDAASVSVKAGMASIGEAADQMAASVKASTAAASEGITALDAEARTVGVSVAAGADEATAALARVAESAKAAAAAMDEMAVASERSSRRAAAGADTLGAKWLGLGPVFDKVKKWGALGLAGIGIASTDLAMHFQTQMTRISTAAGAPISQVKAMRGEVLSTATSVGVSGTKMAEALYHPVSAGLDLKTSLQAVKYAAEEAQISGASLDDTTYSLSSVMKAFNMSAKDAGPTMADLNAIVGEGDMRFQDLNASIKNWAPTAAQMGISVNSMGAGLAYLTDRGNSAEVAATRLTMGISMMTTPSSKATKMLTAMGLASTDVKASSDAMETAMKKAGITQNQLALDLKKPDGLYVALNDLKTSLEKAGVSGTEADSVLSKIFGGGRSDKAIMSLMQNLDGLKGKFQAISHDSSMAHFQQAWQQTTKTLKFQFEQIKAGAENLGIKIGDALLPQVSKFIGLVEKHGAPVAKSLGGMFSGIAAGFTGKAEKGKGKGGSAPQMTGWEKLGQELRHVANDFKTFASDAAKALHSVAQALGPVAAQIGGALVAALRIAGDILAHVVGPALKGFGDFLNHNKGLVKVFADVILGGLAAKLTVIGGIKAATGITNLAAKIIGFPAKQVSAIGDAFKGLKEAGKGVAEAGKALKALATSEKLAAIASKIMAGAQAVLNAVMDANPIVLIVIAIVALVAGLIYAYNHCATFRRIVQEAFHAVEQAGMAIWHTLQAVWNGLVSGVKWLWQHIVSIWHAIASVTTTVWNAIVGFFKKWWPLLLMIFLPFVAAVMAIWNHFHKQIMDTVHTVWNAIKSFFIGMWHGIAGLAQGAWKLILKYIVQPVEEAWKFIVKVWNVIKPYLLAAWHWIVDIAKTDWQLIKRYIIQPITEAWNWLVGKFNQIKNYIGQKLHEAVNLAKDFVKGFFSVGENIVMGIIHGVESAGGGLYDSLKNLADGALKAAKSFLGINSPSLLFADHVGRGIAEGVAKGVDDNTHLAVRSVRSMSASLAGVPVSTASAGGALGLAAAGGGYGPAPASLIVNLTVQGHVLTERDLRDTVQKLFLQLGARNSSTWQDYRR